MWDQYGGTSPQSVLKSLVKCCPLNSSFQGSLYRNKLEIGLAYVLGWRPLSRVPRRLWPNGSGPTREAVKITVVYYYDRIALDADNFIKPVQDALAGVVYLDDGQVSDVTIRRTNLSGSFRVRGMSSILAEGFTTGQEFLYIRIEAAPDHVELL